MKSKFNFAMLILLLLIVSCEESPNKITDVNDYNSYLQSDSNEMLQLTQEDYKFWERKLEKEPQQFPYLVKAATSQSELFNQTGSIEDLIEAEKKLIKANKETGYSIPGYLRALARNYISQHKFRESLSLLKKAEMIGDGLNGTQKMLFDVYLELGNVVQAENYLNKIENYKDFDFLIRLSKWSDYNGDLDKAILYLKKATELAESSKNKWLMQWSYTNLADFYGHNGQIEESYNNYLKALKLNPNDAYAKKGIAWIVYSYERNPKEALRILNSITEQHKSPSYHLLKAEIAEYMHDYAAKKKYLDAYLAEVIDEGYGNMYNKYNAILYTEEFNETKDAAKIALTEIENRPTPESYDLLAWAYLNYGNAEEALDIMEKHVVDKTYNPETLFRLAQVYKANGKLKEAESLKKELLNSTFELGPLMAKKINNI
ncbi:cell surface protein [Flavobacteriaceae bacterium XHP0103]|uniref:tetratricopeptide repeat protein n=1 Tax=Marixanthotalea marina TaxID=2844359 RepID=UPI002989AD9E|nr:cell surface protein [Marixanthotalea marina]MBU3823005.1 cell surface protein [Marixanthotalea marina]